MSAVLAAVFAAYGQVRVVRPSPGPIPVMPVAQPEPTVRVSEDPLTIFQNLIGSSPEQRRQAIVELGWTGDEKFAEDPSFVQNARFYRVNLDDDPEYEAIMTVDIGFGRSTRALIFKRSNNQWSRVGTFSLDYMWGPDEAEHMLELRNIVDFEHKDILIRLTSGGSDIQKEVQVYIYRLYQGRLYRTFQTTEEFAVRRFPTPGVMMIEDEVHRLDYPALEQAKGAFIVLHSSKTSMRASEWGILEPQRNRIDCLPYRWDPSSYAFIADQRAAARLCQPVPGPRIRH